MPTSQTFNGLIVIDKPAGITSHDVVARLRKILGTKKIGHTGTLDPFATGVLVLLVGKATRLARFLDKDEKSYQAVMRFGYETDTGDLEGARDEGQGKGGEGRGTRNDGQGTSDEGAPVVEGVPIKGDLLAFIQGLKSLPPRKELLDRVEAAIPEFCGDIEQVPPMFSAKKIRGKKLYEMAREGVEIERKPVRVSISELYIDGDTGGRADNELRLNVTCSAGTYIRTLAEDIGRKIGVGCHLSELRRTRAGRFVIEEAATLEQLEQSRDERRANELMLSTNDAVAHLPEHRLDEEELKRIVAGMRIDSSFESESVGDVRLTNTSGELVAIGEFCADRTIQPRIVLISE